MLFHFHYYHCIIFTGRVLRRDLLDPANNCSNPWCDMGCRTVERISGNSHVSILYIFHWAYVQLLIFDCIKEITKKTEHLLCVCLIRFCIINAGVLYVYFSSFQQIDEEEYGGTWELTKEGFMTSFALFLVGNHLVYLWKDWPPVKSMINIEWDSL